MSNPFRRICIVALLLVAGSVLGQDGTAHAQSGGASAPTRRPFARPGTQRKTERLRSVDIKHIKLELAVDVKKRAIHGTVTHTLSPLHPFLNQLELDCGSKLTVSKVTAGANRAPCKFETHGDTLTITLDRPYGPGDTVPVAIEYSGAPDKGMRFIIPDPAYPEKPLTVWTQGEAEDNHHWLPCYDFPNDRATTEMIVTVDKPLVVLSNGVLVGTRPGPGNTITYHWKMDVPFVSYLISLAIGDFSIYHDKAGDLPVDYYVARPVDEATARRFMGDTPRMIEFFGKVIDRPYPYAKYAQVCVPEFGGGMENITATTMIDNALNDEIAALEQDFDGLVSHELAHQWFGDLLTCKDWSHLWLNEGFASYFAPLFTEYQHGEDTFRIEMNQEQQGYIGTDRGYRRPIVESRYETPDAMFDAMTYNKGACVLHMLRGMLGDDAWWKGIRGYVAKNQLDVVETDDFRKAMEAGSGKDLKWFFDQWVYKAGHPELKVRWHYESEDRTARIKIEQTQKVDDQTPLFRLPTTLVITEDADHIRTIPIVIDSASQELIVPVSSRPRLVELDPKGWLIKQLDFEKPDAELLYQLEHGTSVLSRLDAAQALAGKTTGRFGIAAAMGRALRREKSVAARRKLVELMSSGNDAYRATLMEAARSPEARIRVAAITGLTHLRRDDQIESILRKAWNDPREAYGARRAALSGLVDWQVADAPKLLESAVKIPSDRHSIAATALNLMLRETDSRSRELASIYCRYGQPSALRVTALAAFPRLAKDDPALQDILVSLINDPDAGVRYQSIGAIAQLKVERAVPALKARLALESNGFSAFGRRQIEQAIEALKGTETTAAQATPGVAELEAQAAELEDKARSLRSRIAGLKKTGTAAKETSSSSGAGTGGF